MRRRGWLAVVVLCGLALAVAACGSSGSSSTSAAGSGASSQSSASSQKPYKAYVSINFAGNPFRQQILKTMQLATQKGQIANKVTLTDSSAAQTVQAQSQDIDNITRRKPDILTILPASSSGLSAAVERACRAGLIVVAFDSVINTPCIYNVGVDFTANSERAGAWLGEQAKGKSGVILVDQGIPGIPAIDEIFKGYEAGIKQTNPNVKLVPFQGQLAPGPEKAAIANLLPAHRNDLLGVASISFGTSVTSAIKEAGLKPVPLATLTGTNGDLEACMAAGQKCLFGATPATEGAEALRLGVELKNGTADKSKHRVILPAYWIGNAGGVAAYPDVKPTPIKNGLTVFPNLPPSLSQPYKADWLPVTPQEVTGQ